MKSRSRHVKPIDAGVKPSKDLEFGLKLNPSLFTRETVGCRPVEVGAFVLLAFYLSEHGTLPDARDRHKVAKVSRGKFREIEREVMRLLGSDCWHPVQRVRGQRPSISKALRQAIFDRDGECCVYCGDTEGPFHLDHVLPFSKGGLTDENNLVVSCASCNLRKHDKTPEEWGGPEDE